MNISKGISRFITSKVVITFSTIAMVSMAAGTLPQLASANIAHTDLIVKKVIVGDPTATADQFSFTTDKHGFGGVVTHQFEADGQNNLTGLSNGTYDVTEAVVSGYNVTYGSNRSGSHSDDCDNMPVDNGEHVYTCTITNTAKPSTLIVKKVVINDNGGTSVASNFSFQVNGGSAVVFTGNGSTGENHITVTPGTYTVTETAASGYTTTYSNCSGISIAAGATKTCTITNDDQAAHIIVTKHVVNDNSGTSHAGDFTMTIGGVTATGGNSFAGSEDGTDKVVTPGEYTVTESGPTDGYTESDSADCSGTIALGETKSCTITNDDIAPTTGTIEITKYACPADTTVTRASNGVGGTAPEGCTLESGATFGYVHGTQTDANGPYPELAGPFAEAGATNGSGVLSVANLPSAGRYLVVETDGSGHQLAYPGSDVIGLFCTGDGDTSGNNDNQELTFVPAGGTVKCVAYNKQAEVPHTTIVASKVVCDSEADLPNWSGTHQPIGATTAADYVAAHPHCHLQSSWSFQWAPTSATNPGDNIVGPAGSPWTTFGETDSNGKTQVSIPMSSVDQSGQVWVREVMKSNYVPFSGLNGSNVSAEMWCNGDVLNYDNLDYARNLTSGGPEYCVAFNALSCNPEASQTIVSDAATTFSGTDGSGNAVPFTMTTLTTSAWTANIPTATWIWSTPAVIDGTIDNTETFTRTFNIVGTPTGATLDIAADNFYSVSVNGHDIDLGAGNASDNNFATAANYVIPAADLVSGANTLTVVAKNEGVAGATGDNNPAAVLFKLVVTNNECLTPPAPVLGCTDETASNFNEAATQDDGSCIHTPTEPTPGTLVIVKNSVGGDGTFTFNVGEATTTSITTGNGHGMTSGISLAPGTTTLTEVQQDGWNFTSVTCDYGSGSQGSDTEYGKDILISSGYTTTCTFTNTIIPVQVIDVCSNIEGNQSEVPSGMHSTGENECVNDTPSTPTCAANEHLSDGVCVPNGGGNGPIAGSWGGAGGSGGSVLGASTSTCSDMLLTDYMRRGKKNDPDQVKKLQQFLNDEMHSNLPLSGVFGKATEDAVKAFQKKYSSDILDPWKITDPTGFVYKTTLRKINQLHCDALNIPMPDLTPYSGE